MVARAFIEKTDNDIILGRTHVNHIDGNKENMAHAYRTGLCKIEEDEKPDKIMSYENE